jgi:cytochrome c-type biogenesis protein CcmH
MNKQIVSIALAAIFLVSGFAAAAETSVPDDKSVSGTVELAAELSGRAERNDTVFIFARAAQGPRMPLAVFKAYVMDLPIKFTLDDSMAMRPQLKLSGFDQVIVTARVSKSGTPMPQSGDIEGSNAAVTPGTKGLKIVINTIVP